MPSGKASPIFEGAKARFLDDILCILIVTRQPSRQIVARIQVRQNGVIESGQLVLVRQSILSYGLAIITYKPLVGTFYSRTVSSFTRDPLRRVWLHWQSTRRRPFGLGMPDWVH